MSLKAPALPSAGVFSLIICSKAVTPARRIVTVRVGSPARNQRGLMGKPSFHDLTDDDQKILSRLMAQTLRRAGVKNLDELCKKHGTTPEEVWEGICAAAAELGVPACTLPRFIRKSMRH